MINYLPKLDTLLWSLKSREVFASIHDLKHILADRHSKISQYIGNGKTFGPHDIKLTDRQDRDLFFGWRNYFTIVLDGEVIGYCGE